MIASQGDVGARIREARLERGLSQTEIAGEALSPSYVSLIESGKRHPTEAALHHLADRLGVDIGWLRDGIDAAQSRQLRLEVGYAEAALGAGDLQAAAAAFAGLQDRPGLDEDLEYRVLYGAATVAERSGDLEGAITLLARLAERARVRPDAAPWLDVSIALCRVYTASGDLEHAVQHGSAALARARDVGLAGTDHYLRLACTVLAAHLERGDLATAGSLIGELSLATDSLGTPQTRGMAYWEAALVSDERGDRAQALQLVERALALFGESDDQRNLARLRTTYAYLMLHQQPPSPEDALALLDEARVDLLTHAGQVDVSSCDTERARAMWMMGRAEEARELLEQVLRDLGPGPRVESARVRVLLGCVLASLGDIPGCLAQGEVAGQMLAAMGAGRQAAAAWRELGDLYRSAGRDTLALDAYDAALRAVKVTPKPGARQRHHVAVGPPYQGGRRAAPAQRQRVEPRVTDVH